MVAVIDADLIGRDKHRFPNLACEKISAHWKALGEEVVLKLDYDDLDRYDYVFISKVFTDTWVPDWINDGVNMDTGEVSLPDNIHVGGTGFFFANAPELPFDIEHQMPDYHLYDDWIVGEVEKAKAIYDQKEQSKYERALAEGEEYTKREFNERNFKIQFKEYTDYSIGFMTRGCFRKCPFCVNQKYDHVFLHSPLEEFYDPTRKKICLLDDNILGGADWKNILNQLIATGKSFKFKQGMDERVLTDEKCKMLFSAKYDGDYTFAFDNIEDYDLIHKRLKLIRKYAHTKKSIKFYVLVGFKSTDDEDIENCFKRIQLLFKYKCLPYVMRYQNKNEVPWKSSENRALYVTIARWANQPSIVKKMSFRQFCEANQALHKTEGTLCSSMKSMIEFEERNPSIAKKYFDMRFEEPEKIHL
jgi:hypothetical protein